jgi:hypothetical protein
MSDLSVNIVLEPELTVNVELNAVGSTGYSSPAAIRDALETLTINDRLNADSVKEGAINKFLSTSSAVSDFLVGTTGGAWLVKTLAQVKTILGLGSAAFVEATAANDMIISSGVNTFVKKTQAEAKTILGIDQSISASEKTLYGTDSICIACSDEATALTAGTAKVTFRMPFAMTLNAGNAGVRINVNTAPVGATLIVDINEGVTSILSTKCSIDAAALTSITAASQVVISDVNLAADAQITIDIDQVGSSTAGKGLKVYLIGQRL